MNVKEILEGMAARAFSASFLDGVCELYDARDNGSTEADYETGMAQLAGILNDEQKADLQEMEQAYKTRRNYVSVYGFKCGLYGAFRQHFVQHTDYDRTDQRFCRLNAKWGAVKLPPISIVSTKFTFPC